MARKKTRANKRGRPRKAGPRFPNGQTKPALPSDKGSGEAQARRLWLAGVDGEARPRDGAPTAYPLGVLLVNGAISEDQHAAAARLAWLYGAVHGRISVAATRYEVGRGGGRGARDDERLGEYQAELKHALEALRRASRHILDDLLNLAVYGRYPAFMRPGFPTARQMAHGERIRAGLDILVALRMARLAALPRKAARLDSLK